MRTDTPRPHDDVPTKCIACGGTAYYRFDTTRTTCTTAGCPLSPIKLSILDRILNILKR